MGCCLIDLGYIGVWRLLGWVLVVHFCLLFWLWCLFASFGCFVYGLLGWRLFLTVIMVGWCFGGFLGWL